MEVRVHFRLEKIRNIKKYIVIDVLSKNIKIPQVGFEPTTWSKICHPQLPDVASINSIEILNFRIL